MSKSDHDFFNCSDEHEVDYVANQYKRPEDAKMIIQAYCFDKTINNWKHSELHKFLEEKNFLEKKDNY